MSTPKKYFGTDGIRGRVGEFPITVDFILKFGWAIGSIISKKQNKKVLIGKDTRLSGYMIESALQAGLSAAGANVYLLGPMPTSAVAYFSQTLSADVGIVISASHNPYDNNGIKLFNIEGFKLSDTLQKAIETKLDESIITTSSEKLGKAKRIDDAAGRYIEYCKSVIPHHAHLTNFKLAIDCANGATYHIAPHVFNELGAHVIPFSTSPNGFNINQQCGTNHPEVIKNLTLKVQADVGIAFDGDGDRVILVDDRGEILDGDEILYIIAKGLVTAENYSGGVIGTHMSNTGLQLALNQLGLNFERVPVGDQNVVKGMLKNNWLLGGEPSGHIIYLQINTTADGIIAALLVLLAMNISGKNLHELKQGMIKFPQCVLNVKHHDSLIDLQDKQIANFINDAEKKLGKYGRTLLRYSGTEHVIRIMAEGENETTVKEVSQSLADLIEQKVNK